MIVMLLCVMLKHWPFYRWCPQWLLVSPRMTPWSIFWRYLQERSEALDMGLLSFGLWCISSPGGQLAEQGLFPRLGNVVWSCNPKKKPRPQLCYQVLTVSRNSYLIYSFILVFPIHLHLVTWLQKLSLNHYLSSAWVSCNGKQLLWLQKRCSIFFA